MPPTVSIVMPAYNRAHVISRAIESIREQSFQDWELIVADDRSTDRTREVVEAMSSLDRRIRYIRSERSKGPGGARNAGMLEARGSFLAFLDSDDRWLPRHLEASLAAIRRTGADVSFALWIERHGVVETNPFEGEVERRLLREMGEKFGRDGETIVFEKGLFEQFLTMPRNFFQLNTMVLRRELLDQVGLIGEEHHLGEDTTFLMRFFDRCRIALQPEPHSVYYESEDSLYFFCDRRGLDPDQIGADEKLQRRFEELGERSVAVRRQVRRQVEQSDAVTERTRRRLLAGIDYGIAGKYYTLAYLARRDRRRSLGYCRRSLAAKPHLLTLLLAARLLAGRSGGSPMLRRALDLW
ncbi:glycosyltransferase family 2 protein [Paenibacillus albicereus]|uniref:Glycosyltransferase family 2 protein n=1 Tax=Paenibacillus albicereus TaxID=2726185 RepID=A0A6H2H0Y1_9BACL|nr:glycosyltransferase family 2 protein [Paenibacillus albicereus]QJC53305.1 glycosyltransferase family 2 protein [Paenibacillus albicereus]